MFKTYRAYVWIPMSSFDGHVCSNLFAKIWGFGDVQICGFLRKKIQVHLSWRHIFSCFVLKSTHLNLNVQFLDIRKYWLKNNKCLKRPKLVDLQIHLRNPKTEFSQFFISIVKIFWMVWIIIPTAWQSIAISIQQPNTIPTAYDSRQQKHVLLFRKSALRVCYKLRHVTRKEMFLFEYLIQHRYALTQHTNALKQKKICSKTELVCCKTAPNIWACY